MSQARAIAPAPAETTAVEERRPVAPVGPGNAAELADAGLAEEADDRDYGLAGPFAGLLLDALPLDEALALARRFLDNPAVRAWVDALDPDRVPELAEAALDGFWPRGLGLRFAGAAAGKLSIGADLDGEVELKRDDSGAIQQDSRLETEFPLASTELGLRGIDAFGRTAGGGKAGAKLSAHLVLAESGPVDLDPLQLARDLLLSGPASLLLVGRAQAMLERRVLEVFGFRARSGRPLLRQPTVTAGLAAKASGRLAAEDPERIAPLLRFARADRFLQRLDAFLGWLAELSGRLAADLVIPPTGPWEVRLGLSGEGKVSWSDLPPTLGPRVAAAVEHLVGMGAEVELRFPFEPERGLPDGFGEARARIVKTTEDDSGAIESGLELPAADLPNLLAGTAELERFTRTVRIPVRPGDEPAGLRGLLAFLGFLRPLDELGGAAFETEADLRVEVEAALEGAALAALGAVARGPFELGRLLDAAVAVRLGAPASAVDRAAAAAGEAVEVGRPRLRGWLRVGIGGGLEAALGPELSGSALARLAGGITVDTPAEDGVLDELAPLLAPGFDPGFVAGGAA